MKKVILSIVGLLLIVSLIVIQLPHLLQGHLPYVFYPSIFISFLILIKIDIKITGEIKIRHSMAYIFLCAATMLLAALSGIDWIFSNLITTEWHFVLTVEGLILFIIILFSAIRSLSFFEPQNSNMSTSEEKMMFG